jgi:hypothetical protein
VHGFADEIIRRGQAELDGSGGADRALRIVRSDRCVWPRSGRRNG